MLKFHLGPRQGCREWFVPTSFCSPIIVLDEAAERATALWGCANVCARDWDLKALYTSLTSCSHSLKGAIELDIHFFLESDIFKGPSIKCPMLTPVNVASTLRRRSVDVASNTPTILGQTSTLRRRLGISTIVDAADPLFSIFVQTSTICRRPVDGTSKFSNEQLPKQLSKNFK